MNIRFVTMTCLGIALLLLPSPASIGMGEGSTIFLWPTMDGGGGTSSTGPWSLRGTIGQHDAGAAVAPPQSEIGGFWGATRTNLIFHDGFESGDASSWDAVIPNN